MALSAGACSVFFGSALTVVMRDLFAVSGLMTANSVIELAGQLSLIAGPAIVGLLAVAGGASLALLADAVTFAVSLASLVTVTPRGSLSGRIRRAQPAARPRPGLRG